MINEKVFLLTYKTVSNSKLIHCAAPETAVASVASESPLVRLSERRSPVKSVIAKNSSTNIELRCPVCSIDCVDNEAKLDHIANSHNFRYRDSGPVVMLLCLWTVCFITRVILQPKPQM